MLKADKLIWIVMEIQKPNLHSDSWGQILSDWLNRQTDEWLEKDVYQDVCKILFNIEKSMERG